MKIQIFKPPRETKMWVEESDQFEKSVVKLWKQTLVRVIRKFEKTRVQQIGFSLFSIMPTCVL